MNKHEITFNTNLSEPPRTHADFTYKISPIVISISDTGLGSRSALEDIEAVLWKIEYWHQDSIAKFKIIYRDGKGFWHGVGWDGKAASCFALSETDERRARKKMRESEGTRTVPEVPLGIITPAVLLISKMTNSP